MKANGRVGLNAPTTCPHCRGGYGLSWCGVRVGTSMELKYGIQGLFCSHPIRALPDTSPLLSAVVQDSVRLGNNLTRGQLLSIWLTGATLDELVQPRSAIAETIIDIRPDRCSGILPSEASQCPGMPIGLSGIFSS